MSWAIGYDNTYRRDIGYGVPAYCDHPQCNAEIDRGLSYVCGGEAYGGDKGCGLYFCPAHLRDEHQRCQRCRHYKRPYPVKPDHPRWIQHKLTDDSWAQWRAENPVEVARLVDAGAAPVGEGATESAQHLSSLTVKP
jgi:hypothetical protein